MEVGREREIIGLVFQLALIKPSRLTGRKKQIRAQVLCESRGGRPGLPSFLTVHTVSVDEKQH